jgi:cytochrome P450
VVERPFYRDAHLGLWVASSASAVTAVLSNPACRVRPPVEPVPQPLVGTRAGAIFGQLARMIDGAPHRLARRAVVATLESLDAGKLARESQRQAASLARIMDPTNGHLTEYAFALSTHVLGSLLGVAEESLPAVTRQMADFVRCLFPGCSPEQMECGKSAAEELHEHFLSLCPPARAARSDSLLARLAVQARESKGGDREFIVANGIGFLTQAYDATAGLIATTLLTLARRPDLAERVARTPALLGAVVDEVLRYDSPVQATRRVVAEVTMIEGKELSRGEVVLVLLAAANRDPRANPDPDRFDETRVTPRVFSFGVDAHACPGQRIATTIATAAVAELLQIDGILERLPRNPAYRSSANTRVPLLD